MVESYWWGIDWSLLVRNMGQDLGTSKPEDLDLGLTHDKTDKIPNLLWILQNILKLS